MNPEISGTHQYKKTRSGPRFLDFQIFHCDSALFVSSLLPSRAGLLVGTIVTGDYRVKVSTFSEESLISGFLLAACTPPPAPAPAADPIAAPLPPPNMPPIIAPAIAPPPT